MANAKTISQNFSISKTLLLYVYLQGFYLLHDMPNHFHVKKGKKLTELPSQREKKILGSGVKVIYLVESS